MKAKQILDDELKWKLMSEVNAQRGLTLASLCDMVLGEKAEDRSDAALIRRVRRLIERNAELCYLLDVKMEGLK